MFTKKTKKNMKKSKRKGHDITEVPTKNNDKNILVSTKKKHQDYMYTMSA